MKGRERKKIFHTLVHSQTVARDRAGQAKPKNQFSPIGRGAQMLEPSAAAAPGTLGGSWIGSRTART